MAFINRLVGDVAQCVKLPAKMQTEVRMERQQHLGMAVVGLGQCGGNFANEFARIGYKAMALNTSTTDLKDLDCIPPEYKLHIGLSGRNGAGKDRRLGLESLQSHKDNIIQHARSLSKRADVLLVVGGMGGGTGSNLGELVGMLAPIGLPVSCMATVPTDSESGITKVNAVHGVNNLTRSALSNLIIIDNAKILKIFPDASIADFYKRANQLVVKTLAEFNSTANEMKSVSIRSFDSEDFRKVFLSGGVIVFGGTSIKADEHITEEMIFSRMRQIWDSSGLLAEGIDYSSASLAAVVLYAPEQVLARSSATALEKLAGTIKHHTKGAAVYTGIYQLKEPGPVRVYTMLGRLALPNRMASLMSQAAAEGRHLSRKIRQKAPTMDLSEVEGMDFFLDGASAFDATMSMDANYGSLMSALKDPDREVRKRAVIRLGEKGDPASSSAVISLLNDPDDGVRMEAAKALKLLFANNSAAPGANT